MKEGQVVVFIHILKLCFIVCCLRATLRS